MDFKGSWVPPQFCYYKIEKKCMPLCWTNYCYFQKQSPRSTLSLSFLSLKLAINAHSNHFANCQQYKTWKQHGANDDYK